MPAASSAFGDTTNIVSAPSAARKPLVLLVFGAFPSLSAMHSSSTILDQTSCVSSPSAGRFGPCCCDGYIHVSIPDGLVVVWVPGLGIVPDTPLAQSQEGVTSPEVAPVSLPTQCERSRASGGQALVPELQEPLTANASPAPTGSAMMLALPPGMPAAVAQLGFGVNQGYHVDL